MSHYGQDEHMNQCEDHEYYFCKNCSELVHQTDKNQCPQCKLFIPRTYECVCDRLENARMDTY